MNLAHFDARGRSGMDLAPLDGPGRGGKGRGQGRGKGRGGKGSGYHGPEPTIRRGAVGQVGTVTARQGREPNRDSRQLHFLCGDRVPGSINAKTGDADTTFRRRSKTECLDEKAYKQDHKQLQNSIRLILETEYQNATGPRRTLCGGMPPSEDDAGGFKKAGELWSAKINAIANDRSVLPHPMALLRNLLIAEAREGMHAGEMIMHLHEATSLATPDSEDLSQGRI